MRKWYPLLLVGLTLVISFIAYPKLPDRVPTHWGLHNEVNGYSPRWLASVLMPGMIILFWARFRLAPRVDPRGSNYEKFGGAYDLIIASVLALLAAIHVFIMASAVGYRVDIGRAALVMVGLLLIAVGNVLPRARPNWFVGVRTPWTLSNDRVWERTHRVSGYLMVIAGLFTIALAWARPEIAGPGVGILVVGASLASVAYSYVAWRQETSR